MLKFSHTVVFTENEGTCRNAEMSSILKCLKVIVNRDNALILYWPLFSCVLSGGHLPRGRLAVGQAHNISNRRDIRCLHHLSRPLWTIRINIISTWQPADFLNCQNFLEAGPKSSCLEHRQQSTIVKEGSSAPLGEFGSRSSLMHGGEPD